LIQHKGLTSRFLITGCDSVGLVFIANVISKSMTELNEYNHSLDQGKTWLPCGVQE